MVLGAGCGSEALGTNGAGGRGAGTGASGGGTTTGGVSGSAGAGAGGLSDIGSACRENTDCGGGVFLELCLPVGQTSCGICSPASDPCTTDADCATDGGAPQICQPGWCSCSLGCVSGCLTDADCGQAQSCGADHHCAGVVCDPTASAPCPVNFVCGADGRCGRQGCTLASDCGGATSTCLDNFCSSTTGTCQGVNL
jgi:hypothetical protein